MKTTLAFTIQFLLLSASLFAAEKPTGHETPEGIACDAVQAYADCDSKAWLKTLIRPIYGDDSNKEYELFKKKMATFTDANKDKEDFVAPKIVKVFKARNFTKNGPGSLAYAMFEMTGNKFVDIVIDTGGGNLQNIRYHILLDTDKKWYFEPRPDLAQLLSMGLNNETPSEEVLWEVKKNADPK